MTIKNLIVAKAATFLARVTIKNLIVAGKRATGPCGSTIKILIVAKLAEGFECATINNLIDGEP